MFRPTLLPPTSKAPRLPASMMPGPAAGDDVDRLGRRGRAARDDRREAARLVVVARHRGARSRPPRSAFASPAACAASSASGATSGATMRALPKMTIGRLDALLVLHQLGLEQLELHPHRAQLLAQQEIGVGEGEPVRALGPS